jgi:hypothetical protein
MKIRSCILMFAATAVAAALLLAPVSLSAQTAQTPRLHDGKPNFNGVWARPRVGDVMKDQTGNECGSGKTGCSHKGAGNVGLTPLAKEIMSEPAFDYTSFCLPWGYTRAWQTEYPVEIIQTPERLAILFESNTVFKVVPTDGRPLPRNPDPTWFGHSVGRYEGDALIIDSVGFNGRTTLDVGADHPSSPEMHITERFRLLDADRIAYDLTIEDPKLYTQPIKNSRVFVRMKGEELLESFCMENNKNLIEGRMQIQVDSKEFRKYFDIH